MVQTGPVEEVITDAQGLVHVRENGVHHTTWCGQAIPISDVPSKGYPNCMMCLGGPSHIDLADLLFAKGLWILMAALDAQHLPVTSLVPVCLDEGQSVTAPQWKEFSAGAVVLAVGYYRRDGYLLHASTLQEPLHLREQDTLIVNATLTLAR